MNWIPAIVAIFCIYTCASTATAIPISSNPENAQEDWILVNETSVQDLSLVGSPELRSFPKAPTVEDHFDFDEVSANRTWNRRTENLTRAPIPMLSNPETTEEDWILVDKSIRKYGFVQSFSPLGFPGLELRSLPEASTIENQFDFDKVSGNYTLKLRGLTPLFGYNRRYEDGSHAKSGKTPLIRGYFTEHFERKSGGFYVRTIGYILNDDGFQQFLLDISKGVKTSTSIAFVSLTSEWLVPTK